MNDFLQAIGPFVYGFIVGFFWNPIFTLARRIYEEAKLARKQWSNPNGDRNV